MPIPTSLLLLLLIFSSALAEFHYYQGQGYSEQVGLRLSKTLVEDDGKVYACSGRYFYAFEGNGSVSWSLQLPFACNMDSAPVRGDMGKIYLIAENRILIINYLGSAASPPTSEVFFGPEKGQPGAGDIVGIAVCTLSSRVFISIRSRGLFAYSMSGKLKWSVGPVLSQHGYRLGCRKGVTDCYFASAPVIDKCEACIYISNNAGEVYSLSVRTPHFNWVRDLSSYESVFAVTPGNNGHLYVTMPSKSLILALDVSTGNILWETGTGPLGAAEYTPVVDSNGWVSVGSVDGFLYSISPAGVLRKFTKVSELDHAIQVSPSLDCSGYGVYISQTVMEGKVDHVIGDSVYVSAMRPSGAVFTLLAPATGTIHWSERYPGGQLTSSLSQSDLKHFVVDEAILLAFLTAARAGNPLRCRSKHEKLFSSCSRTRPKKAGIYTENSRSIMLFLLFESITLVIFAGLVQFCCIFWKKKKLQGQDLGNFLHKRRSLLLKKKAFDRTITELKQKAKDEATASNVIDEIGELIREKQGIERKLSTTYSLGRDKTGSNPRSLLPVYNRRSRSYSFQGAKRESVTFFHSLTDTSSGENSDDRESSSWGDDEEAGPEADSKGKALAVEEEESSSEGGTLGRDYWRSPSEPVPISKGYADLLLVDQEKMAKKRLVGGSTTPRLGVSSSLQRRALSSTN